MREIKVKKLRIKPKKGSVIKVYTGSGALMGYGIVKTIIDLPDDEAQKKSDIAQIKKGLPVGSIEARRETVFVSKIEEIPTKIDYYFSSCNVKFA